MLVIVLGILHKDYYIIISMLFLALFPGCHSCLSLNVLSIVLSMRQSGYFLLTYLLDHWSSLLLCPVSLLLSSQHLSCSLLPDFLASQPIAAVESTNALRANMGRISHLPLNASLLFGILTLKSW